MEKIQLQLLSSEEKEKIHESAFHILQEVGLAILDPEALSILEDAGARVDRSTQRVRFPRELIEWALSKTPHELKLFGRDISRMVHLRDGAVYYSTSGYAVQYLDPALGKRREITQEALKWITQVADGLDQVDLHAVMDTPIDVPPENNDRYQLAIALSNTTRHIWNTAYGREGVEDAVRMATIVRGSREALKEYPLFTLDLTTLSPLQLDERQATTMIAGAREWIPIGISPGPMGGATAPVTLAGTLTQANAEFLGALTLCQVVQPGIPVIYTQWTRSLDMASGSIQMGGPEFSLLRIATAEMARFYQLPCRGGGLMTDGKAADAQMGAEKLMNCLMASLAGLNIVAGVGQTDFINTVRIDEMLVDNEIISMVRRLCRGIKITDETMAVDVIERIGPFGNFLADEHTVANFRKELWFPKLMDRQVWSVWEDNGALDISARATMKIMTSSTTPPPLDDVVYKELWKVVEAADKQHASK